jgi:tRNA A-37 threonylcarbamoyl transferase component Bud32
MKILFKCSEQINQKTSINLELDLSLQVSEVRARISRMLEIPLLYFQLVTKRYGQTILLTDTWPLEYFIIEEYPKIKVKLLDLSFISRNESCIYSSPSSTNFDMGKSPKLLRPFDIAISACKNSDYSGLKDLIENDESKDDEITHLVQRCGWGLLHYACLSGCEKIVGYLVLLKVNCNKVTIDGWTPLQISCYFNYVNCVSELLRSKILQINKKTKFRGTPLHIACEKGHKEIIKLLLEKSPAINIEDYRGKTPIELVKDSEIFEMLAVYSGNLQLKKYSVEEVQIPFCSEVFIVNSFSLHDKQGFLYMDVEKRAINRYDSKDQFLDNQKPKVSTRLVDIQHVYLDKFRKDHYTFIIESSKTSFKYYTKHEILTFEWIKRIKKATEYCLINFQNEMIEDIVETPEKNKHEDDADDDEQSTFDSVNNLNSDTELVDFGCFTIMDEIGSGSFGIVYKVKKNNTEEYYALKSLSKGVLEKQRQLKYAISECKIMKQISHPFILPLYYAFNTPKYLYLILELCLKGDLLAVITKKGVLDETTAKFYIAEVILALDYLHSLGIVYRDLKPANILISDDYHIKLADFGLAKQKVNKVNPALTMAGTPAYLPPEIIDKRGATPSSDIYGLGPLLYELLIGKTPHYSDDIELLFQNIKTAKVSFPKNISNEAKDFITIVMNKEPTKRPSISQLKRHQLFRKFDWKALLDKKVKPPRIDLE